MAQSVNVQPLSGNDDFSMGERFSVG
jgi:hypothetical protein